MSVSIFFQLWYLNIGSQKDDQSATSALLDLVIENHVASTHLARDSLLNLESSFYFVCLLLLLLL